MYLGLNNEGAQSTGSGYWDNLLVVSSGGGAAVPEPGTPILLWSGVIVAYFCKAPSIIVASTAIVRTKIALAETPLEDHWIRDTRLVFVTDGQGKMAVVDLNFRNERCQINVDGVAAGVGACAGTSLPLASF